MEPKFGVRFPSSFRFHFSHLEDDLKRLPIGEQSLTEMSEDEKNFYYFKLHDSDNNDNLDGLEMLHAATHHHSKSDGQLHGIDRAATQTGDDRAPLLDDDEFNHIIGKECM